MNGEIELALDGQATLGSVLDALETQYPVLRGAIRDRSTLQPRPFVRFYACKEDLSHELPGLSLAHGRVIEGIEPFLIVGAMAGG